MEIQPETLQPKPKPIRKVSFPSRDEEMFKVVKLEKGSKRVQKPASPRTVKPFKLSKENIEARLSEIQTKYPIDNLILKFKQASILLESNHEKGFLDTLVDPLIQSLHLEIEIQVTLML